MQLKKTLDTLLEGQKAIVKALAGGREFQHSVVNLGLTPGCRLEVISKSPGGGRILILTDRGRIALGHGMAEKILVG
ncbi:MAG: ferrous iron transport protein A [Victivallales bacterium]|jgi:Fe2+ transport system protein FeoA|nr:ferrous iron transport protein A [Victivallales bacterium]